MLHDGQEVISGLGVLRLERDGVVHILWVGKVPQDIFVHPLLQLPLDVVEGFLQNIELPVDGVYAERARNANELVQSGGLHQRAVVDSQIDIVHTLEQAVDQ